MAGQFQASCALDGQGTPLAQTRGGATSYTLPDGQGSVRAMADSGGAITDRYAYDAFGNLTSSQGTTANPYRFDSQRQDALTGLYQLRARSYDPTTGRFLSQDTAAVDLANPVEVDRYVYAQANPVGFSDPSGRDDAEEYGATLVVDRPVVAPEEVPGPVGPTPGGPAWGRLAVVIIAVIAAILVALARQAGSTPGPNPGPTPAPAGGGRTGPASTPDKTQYIYRNGPNVPKSVALRREIDWITGLSFSTFRRRPDDLRYNVATLLAAGYYLKFDGGTQITDVHTGQPPDPARYPDPRLQGTFGAGHVSLVLPDVPGGVLAGKTWDAWYQAEAQQVGQPNYSPSPETRRLYALQDPGP